MKWKIILALIIAVFVSALILVSGQTQTITDVNPRIGADFNETVKIDSATFFNKDKLEFIDALWDSSDDRAYTFFPKRALPNGLYELVIFANDSLDNKAKFGYEFKVELKEPKIFLLEPNKIGVSNSTVFDIVLTIGGVLSATCKYKASVIKNFDQPGLNVFLNNPDYEFTIKDYSVPVDNPRPLFIICKDNLGRIFGDSFMFYSDISKPTLQNIRFSPDPVVEYPLTGDITSRMSAITDEPTLCKYHENKDVPYDSMKVFDGFNSSNFDAFTKTNTVSLKFPLNVTKESFSFYVQCQDRAGWLTEKVKADILVDMTAALALNVISPPKASKETDVQINISTNKLAYCRYKTEDRPYSDMSSNFVNVSRFHNLPPMVLPTGEYTFTFYCFSDQSGDPEEVEQQYNFVIDTNPPQPPVVNTSSQACGDLVKASASATDDLSGISMYSWEFKAGNTIIASGNSSDGNIKVTQDNEGNKLNLTPDTTYKFAVKAFDGAGNEGPIGNSQPITYDASGISCDVTPPTVKLIRSIDGFSATLECTDDISGCLTYQYGSVTQEPCNATTYAFPPFSIPIYMTTIICWEVADAAGNVAKGSEIVEVNVSGAAGCDSGLDNDGDGYGELCANGPDCDDTNASIFINCPSGCVQDTDGDGYGLGCILGNDCNGHNVNLTNICSNGCVSDNDGDGYGLGCDNGPDCDGTDYTLQDSCMSGCLDDNDGDGYGLLCIAGLDCNGENPNERTLCSNGCISDLDGDGYGLGCQNGFDCNGRDEQLSTTCENGCLLDEDGDGYGLGCFLGLDTDGLNPFITNQSPNNCISDNDGDSYGWGCDSGLDCDDTDYTSDVSCDNGCMQDTDGDGFGLCCDAGKDCDDFNVNIVDNCTENCTYDLDCDNIFDAWESLNGLNSSLNDALENPDGDNYSNLEEFCNGLDPNEPDIEEVIEEPEKDDSDKDTDGDGMLDSCENAYSVLDPKVDDANDDPDEDGLTNIEECSYLGGLCRHGTNPGEKDSDFDGYDDLKEINAGTDPCDADSKPSGFPIGLILIILGLLMVIGGTAWGVYKKYYLPLIAPTPSPKVKPAQQKVTIKPAGMQTARAIFKRRPKPKVPSLVSSDKFLEAQKKKVKERLKVFDAFGKAQQQNAKQVMEHISRKPKLHERITRGNHKPINPAVRKHLEHKIGEDQVNKLTKVIARDSFDKLTSLTKGQADEFSKLATLVHKKKEHNQKLAEDEVDKLAKITQAVVHSKPKKETLKKVIQTSDFDVLESLPSKKGKLDDFLGEMGKPGRDDVFDALQSITKPKTKPSAADKLSNLAKIESKDDVLEMVQDLSKDGEVDKNVFQVILSYLLKSGKLSKRDIGEMLLDLEKQKVLGKKDISEVFFNLKIEH